MINYLYQINCNICRVAHGSCIDRSSARSRQTHAIAKAQYVRHNIRNFSWRKILLYGILIDSLSQRTCVLDCGLVIKYMLVNFDWPLLSCIYHRYKEISLYRWNSPASWLFTSYRVPPDTIPHLVRPIKLNLFHNYTVLIRI